MSTSKRVTPLALAVALTGCSAEWRSENRDQELWWNMAERGPIALVRTDPFACSGDAYSCHVASREHLAERCAQEDAFSCYRVATTLFLKGNETDDEDARHFLELACRVGWKKGDRGATHACTLLGVGHLVGLPGFVPDPKIGTNLLGERCMMKDDLACAYYAYARERGLGVEADLPRATEDYEGLCSARGDGFEDDPEAESKAPPRRRWQPFACLRLAFLAENHVIDETPEFVAQLFGAVCFHSGGTATDETTAEADPSAIGRIACPIAADKFLASGYSYRQLRAAPGGYRSAEASLDLDTAGLVKRGCSDGSAHSCNILRSMFEGAEARGEIFDLR